eukprot:829599-Pelagomonas_calceolata.AAC.1
MGEACICAEAAGVQEKQQSNLPRGERGRVGPSQLEVLWTEAVRAKLGQRRSVAVTECSCRA